MTKLSPGADLSREQEDLISLTQIILSDKELGDVLRRIIESDDKTRANLIEGLASLLKKKGLAPELVRAVRKLKIPEVAAEIRKLVG